MMSAADLRFGASIAGRMGTGLGREFRAAPLRLRSGGGAPPTGFDPLSAAVLAEPHAAYDELLAGARVHHCRRRGLWILARHEDVGGALKDHDRLSNVDGILRLRTSTPAILGVDRPEHSRLRRLVAADFTRDAMTMWEPGVRRLAAEALDGMVDQGSTDYAARLTQLLPITVIALVLGVPVRDRPAFTAWSRAVARAFELEANLAAAPDLMRFIGASVALRRYFLELRERRRVSPVEDVLTTLSTAELTDEQFAWFCLQLLSAGNETTTHLLGSMLVAIAEHPDQIELMRDRPELISQAVEESLRHASPVQATFRTARVPYEVGDVTIPAGARVMLVIAAANRDPRIFVDPARFDVRRDASQHLAFGGGIHFCLGAHLARLECRVVLEELLRRTSRVELAGVVRWSANPSFRGPIELPVRLHGASAGEPITV